VTAVLAVLLVLGAVVLCAVAWHTRHPDAPGIPDREAGALTAWDPAELREWTLELHHTKSTLRAPTPGWRLQPLPATGPRRAWWPGRSRHSHESAMKHPPRATRRCRRRRTPRRGPTTTARGPPAK
jgi:hypothetical protein